MPNLPPGFRIVSMPGNGMQDNQQKLPIGFKPIQNQEAQQQPMPDNVISKGVVGGTETLGSMPEVSQADQMSQGIPGDVAKKQLLEQQVTNRDNSTHLPADQAPKQSMPLGKALIEGVKAFPESATKIYKNLYDAVTNPGQTWEGFKALGKDIYKNQMEVALKDMGFTPSEIKFREGHILNDIEDTKALDGIVADYEKRFGSYEGFKEAVAKDPANVLMDIGAVLMPTAKTVQGVAQGANMGKLASVAGKVGKIAALTEPVSQVAAVAKPISKLIGEPMGFLGRKLKPTKLYQDAAKMSTAINESDRIKLVKTALDENILPNLEGLDKMDNMIQSLDTKIADIIEKAQKTGEKMPVDELFKEFKNIEETYKLSGKSKESIGAIRRIKKGFLDTNKNIDSLTPKEAQRMKQRVYKDLRSYYESVKSSPASVEAQQAMARASKEFLESLAPEIKELNRRDGSIIALRNALGKPASRIQNRALVGLGSGVKTGLGGGIGTALGSPEAGIVAGITFSILTDPIVQARIAVSMNRVERMGKNISKKTVDNLNKLGFKRVEKAGKAIWTPQNRIISEKLLKETQQEEDK